MEFSYLNETKYYQKGKNPKLVILSGTHGDEYHVIAPLIEIVEKQHDDLPDFLFIPEVSPSAVKMKQRKNRYGNDVNRNINKLKKDPEVAALMTLLSPVTNALGITFHEDLHHKKFYIYDSGSMHKQVLIPLQETLKHLGVPLLTGTDDETDPALSYYVQDGYIDLVGTPTENGQFIDDWAILEKRLSRMLTFEIPHTHKHMSEIIEACLFFAKQLL